ncbi:PepSY domain-containing protein [Ornithobacterium rhinotracheale]|uniref:PepSY-associated TM helix domain-containing protein n=1 Tax=Ornithobacterium rhinotracheale TaxID=28251 RepID=UPI00129C2553|nr:PepSY-associated TM helix domain-containing protein [Ornithobacterium rhinotracheale]MRJ09932.1 PepSY domain-containing protein [Ornithobacterium rhinotracheale]
MNWKKIREWFRVVHLWAGLIGGVFIFILCLTGSVLVFRDDLTKVLNPSVFKIQASGEKQSIEQLIQNIESKTHKKVVSFELTNQNTEAYTFMLKDKKQQKGRPESIYVNPYDAQILGNGKDLVGSGFFMFNFKLHRWLLLPMEAGRPVMGVATLLFVLGLMTGMVVWFPKNLKHYKRGFKIKWKANWKRINHDFHSSFGLYLLVFLFVMGVTGLCWSFGWWKDASSFVLGAEIFNREKTEIKVPTQGENLTLNQMVEKAKQQLLYEYDVLRFSDFNQEEKAIAVNAYKNGFAAISLPDTYYFSNKTGKVLEQELIKDLAFNEFLAKSVHDLHMGKLYGTLNKIIFLLFSLIGALLPITGFLIWWNKGKKLR